MVRTRLHDLPFRLTGSIQYSKKLRTLRYMLWKGRLTRFCRIFPETLSCLKQVLLLRLRLESLFCTFLIIFVASLDEKIFGFINFELKFAE